MDKSKQPVRKKPANEAGAGKKTIPSQENKLIERFDEADPLHDRTPAGDAGPEDNDDNRSPVQDDRNFY